MDYRLQSLVLWAFASAATAAVLQSSAAWSPGHTFEPTGEHHVQILPLAFVWESASILMDSSVTIVMTTST